MSAADLAPARPAFAFRSVARSHAGLRRALNEDRVLEQPDAGLWAVADGMGGHRGGDVAAAQVVAALAQVQTRGSGYGRLTDLLRRVGAVNAELWGRRRAGGPSGSTLVALLLHEAHYACLWAGDSRAYLLRDGVLSVITRDHSVVQDLIDAGRIAESSRRDHPETHVITRAVGARDALALDQRFAPVKAGDLFLLCTDGLTACVSEADMAGALRGGDLAASADRLIALALERGAPDNVSVVVVRADPVPR